MFESASIGSIARNLSIYAVGVGLSVVGALGLADAIELLSVLSAVLFVGGLVIVLLVHEYLGGPV